jgi:hypothetical protein
VIQRIVLMLMIASASVALAQTGTPCPWVSVGSVANVLGGDVKMVVQTAGNWNGSCRFTRQIGNVAQTLDILVGKTNAHLCPEGSQKLNALGNEAVQCQRRISPTQEADTIAGRVRDVFFSLTMTNVAEATRERSEDGRPTDPFGASPLEQLAEQVAGNLF